MTAKVNAVRSVTIGTPDLGASAKFYREIWGLLPVLETPEAIYLRGTGPDHHLLALKRHPRPEILGLDLLTESRASADALHAAVGALGLPVTAPARITEPGGGYGFTLYDHEGRTIRSIAEETRNAPLPVHPDRPIKITHVVLNSGDKDMSSLSKLFCDAFGFSVINVIRAQSFLKCNEDHHTLAFFCGESNSLNHIAFAMKDVDAVVRGAARMQAHGRSIGWGVGQHTAGEDVYAYFEGPEGGAIEYICKVPLGWDGATMGIANWDVEKRPNPMLAAAQRRLPFRAAASA